MPTTYRGKVLINCKQEVCVRDKAVADVTPQCLACPESMAIVIDLEEKPLGVIEKQAAAETEEQEAGADEAPINKKRKKY